MPKTAWAVVICAMAAGLFLAARARPENYFGAWVSGDCWSAYPPAICNQPAFVHDGRRLRSHW